MIENARPNSITELPVTAAELAAMVYGRVDCSDPDACWLRLRGLDNDGYGRQVIAGQRYYSHRLSYVIAASIPDGYIIDHLCRVRNCVNPSHLEPVTRGVNVLRGTNPPAVNARRTHCIHGHEFTADNTRIAPSGKRVCLACELEGHRRRGGWQGGPRNADKTHCPRGHEYTSGNVLVTQRRQGWTERKCRTCQRAAEAAWRARRKAAQLAEATAR